MTAFAEPQELLDSRQMTISQGGKKTLQQVFVVAEADPAKVVLMGPPYGARFGNYGLFLKSKTADPVQSDEICTLTCTYESPDFNSNPPIDYVFWDVDISTETQQRNAVKRLSDRTYYPSSAGENETSLLINEDANGDAQGVQILVPRVELTAKVLRRKKFWTPKYQNIVYGLTGKVNSKKFQGWGPEEALFVGCQKTDSGDDNVSLTYKFLCQKSENASFTTADSEVTFEGIGWRYVWQKIREVVGADKKPKKQTVFVAMDKVYEVADFTTLGLTEADSEVTDDTPFGIL